MENTNEAQYEAEKSSLITRQYINGIIGGLSAAATFAGIASFIPAAEHAGKILNLNPLIGGILAVGGGIVTIVAGIRGRNIQFDLEEFNRKRNAVHLSQT